MKTISLVLFLSLLCAVVGHSWLDCVSVVDPTNTQRTLTLPNVLRSKCNGFPRNYVSRSVDPDLDLHKIVGISKAQLPSYPACRSNTKGYSATYPRTVATAGQTLTALYTPNGHTRWHRTPPPNGPREMWVKWSGVAGRDLMTMADVTAAPTLVRTMFDQPCHSRATGAELDSSSGLCMFDYTIPAGTAPGVYQLVWWWPFNFQGGNVVEEYTTCWEVEVRAGGNNNPSATTGVPPAMGTTGINTNGQTLTLAAVDDSYVRGAQYAAENHGADADLIVKTTPNGAAEFDRIGYLKFDLSSFAAQRARVTSARLTVSASTRINLQVSKVNSDTWTEETLNWNNKPAAGAAVGTLNGNVGVVSLDVTNLIRAETDGAISFQLTDAGRTDTQFVIRTKESSAANAPKLVVTIGNPGQRPDEATGEVILTGETTEAVNEGELEASAVTNVLSMMLIVVLVFVSL